MDKALVDEAYAVKALSYPSVKTFDMNFQQIKPDFCDIFVRVAVWRNKITYWVLNTEEVKNNKYYMGKQHLFATYGTNAVMLELGLPLEETIEETAEEWRRTMRGLAEELLPLPKTTIVNVGSGTICAGLIRGWMPEEGTIIGVMGRSGRKKRKWNTIQEKSKRSLKQPGSIFGVPFRLEDPGWEYTEKSLCKCFFPCHPYYDRKAWQWLVEHIEELPQPILFWNIGRMNT